MKDLSSRFSGAPTYVVGEDAVGGRKELFRPRAASAPATVALHRVVAGDRLDLLAFRYFGDAAQYFRIVDANPCVRPEELLEVGRVLRIPEVG
jgi:nucleoid-associated protein YgaU